MAKKKSSTPIQMLHPSQWSQKRLKALLKKLAKKRILVIGDVGVDRYTIGLVERISPEGPVPIVQVAEEKLKLGLAANVADNIRALNAVPLLAGVLGRDRGAEDFKGLLKDAGISGQHLVQDPTRCTILKERIVSGGQQLLRVDYETRSSISAKIESQLIQKVRDLMPKCDAVILEDYGKGLLSQDLADEIFRAAHSSQKWISVDPSRSTPVSHYRGASVLTPNTREAEALSRISIHDDQSLLEAGRKILAETAARYVVITLGKDGMAIFSAENPRVNVIPTYAREVYDVSGAGDTVISVMTLALSAGASIDEAVVLSNLAAGVEVGKRGTATVSPEEIVQMMELFGTLGA